MKYVSIDLPSSGEEMTVSTIKNMEFEMAQSDQILLHVMMDNGETIIFIRHDDPNGNKNNNWTKVYVSRAKVLGKKEEPLKVIKRVVHLVAYCEAQKVFAMLVEHELVFCIYQEGGRLPTSNKRCDLRDFTWFKKNMRFKALLMEEVNKNVWVWLIDETNTVRAFDYDANSWDTAKIFNLGEDFESYQLLPMGFFLIALKPQYEEISSESPSQWKPLKIHRRPKDQSSDDESTSTMPPSAMDPSTESGSPKNDEASSESSIDEEDVTEGSPDPEDSTGLSTSDEKIKAKQISEKQTDEIANAPDGAWGLLRGSEAGDHKGKVHFLTQKKAQIGRSATEENDVTITGDKISRIHCVINAKNLEFVALTDLKSTFGTFVNRKHITGTTEILNNGDLIWLGSEENSFTLEIIAKAESAKDEPVTAAAGDPAVAKQESVKAEEEQMEQPGPLRAPQMAKKPTGRIELHAYFLMEKKKLKYVVHKLSMTGYEKGNERAYDGAEDEKDEFRVVDHVLLPEAFTIADDYLSFSQILVMESQKKDDILVCGITKNMELLYHPVTVQVSEARMTIKTGKKKEVIRKITKMDYMEYMVEKFG